MRPDLPNVTKAKSDAVEAANYGNKAASVMDATTDSASPAKPDDGIAEATADSVTVDWDESGNTTILTSLGKTHASAKAPANVTVLPKYPSLANHGDACSGAVVLASPPKLDAKEDADVDLIHGNVAFAGGVLTSLGKTRAPAKPTENMNVSKSAGMKDATDRSTIKPHADASVAPKIPPIPDSPKPTDVDVDLPLDPRVAQESVMLPTQVSRPTMATPRAPSMPRPSMTARELPSSLPVT